MILYIAYQFERKGSAGVGYIMFDRASKNTTLTKVELEEYMKRIKDSEDLDNVIITFWQFLNA